MAERPSWRTRHCGQGAQQPGLPCGPAGQGNACQLAKPHPFPMAEPSAVSLSTLCFCRWGLTTTGQSQVTRGWQCGHHCRGLRAPCRGHVTVPHARGSLQSDWAPLEGTACQTQQERGRCCAHLHTVLLRQWRPPLAHSSCWSCYEHCKCRRRGLLDT